jgi:hypothetical protein
MVSELNEPAGLPFSSIRVTISWQPGVTVTILSFHTASMGRS